MATQWFKNAVIYSIDVDTLRDGNGDGIGDFVGLRMALSYLAGLPSIDSDTLPAIIRLVLYFFGLSRPRQQGHRKRSVTHPSEAVMAIAISAAALGERCAQRRHRRVVLCMR
jgi:hypothetical protein